MKQIIVLERLMMPGTVFRYVLWAAVPAARQAFYANPSAKSAWKDASAAELTALQNGSVVERLGQINKPPGTTQAAVKAELQEIWTQFQSDVTGANDWSKYGSFWDGTTWTDGGA